MWVLQEAGVEVRRAGRFVGNPLWRLKGEGRRRQGSPWTAMLL